jgi:hypothetical protein
MTKIYLQKTDNPIFNLFERIKDIFPDKHHYITGYLDNIVKVSFPSNTMILKDEYDKLNKILTITAISYDKDMNRIVFMGYINGA